MSSPMYSVVYWLYYTSFSYEEIELSGLSRTSLENHKDFKKMAKYSSLPGLACSQDSRHWIRIQGDRHSGALFDVGLERDWDSLFIASPKVIFHDPRMYYHSFDIENMHFRVGVARSRDGIGRVKDSK
ncbi:hypothetical protein ACSBR2_039871 [Camellia fascicularis]